MKKIKIGSDFSGVGAFNQALMRLGIDFEEAFACDMDKYARQTFIHNYGEPSYFPFNVYDREIPKESLDIYMTSPPCQAFSLAGKRLGKEDKRGILFFNSLELIQVNKPRFFIFENVKGLLSDDGGKTFQEWVNLLGGKSINGLPIIFPYEDSVPYHLYWKVLNAKNHGVPQNRERVFLIGIRDDQDNSFQFPKEEHLTKRLVDILEEEVFEKYFLNDKQIENIQSSEFIQERERIQEGETSSTLLSRDYKSPKCVKVKSNLEKYYLSEKMINGFLAHNKRHIEEKNQEGFNWKPKDVDDIANCLRANPALCATDNSIKVVAFGRSDEEKKRRREHFKKTGKDSGGFKEKELILKDQEHYDTLLANPNPTKEGLIAVNNEGTIIGTWRTHKDGQGFREIHDGNCPTIPARAREDGSGQPVVMQLNQSKESNGQQPYQQNRIYDINGIAPALNANLGGERSHNLNTYKVRRLTPRECFRLMDFPDTFTWTVSDSQAYKQAGNSIVVNVLYKILKNLNI
jgi:DNA-cytosine methyltransferase